MFDHIAVVGAGAWGSALANVIARAGRAVLLAARDQRSAERLASTRHSPHLPGVKFDDRVGIAAATDAVGRYDAILLAVPSQHLRAAAGMLASTLAAGTPVVACAKGIEHGTHNFMTEVVAESVPQALPAILSGPSFAIDVAHGLPTAVTLAARDSGIAAKLARGLGSDNVPALSHRRYARRRDRRRGQERAGDRGRHRRMDDASAPVRLRRSPRVDLPNCSGSARRMAQGPKP